MHFLKGWKLPNFQYSEPLKWQKTADLELLDSPKLISRKIWVTEKSWNFRTVFCYSIFRENKPFTMWKFQDFSVNHILREIKFRDSRSTKSAISTHSEALKFDYYEFLHFLKAEIYLNNQIHSPYNCKTCMFRTFAFSENNFT